MGTALGKQKILAIDGGFDKQSSYQGRSGNVIAAIPVHGGDEAGGQFQYFHYDGGGKFLTISKQNDSLVEGAYYSRCSGCNPSASSNRKLSPIPPDRPKTSTAGVGARTTTFTVRT